MEVKFKEPLTKYKYLVMFDLASKVTGVCLWSIPLKRPVETSIIKVPDNSELPVYDLYLLLDQYFKNLINKGINLNQVLVYQEAMPVQLRGGSSTVQTFLVLARSHAVLDLYTKQNNIAIYDYTGVYPVSTHAYLKKILSLDKDHKVTKEDIKEYVEAEYKLANLTFDESDAVFLAKTFVENKWNKDIQNEIRAVKRHIKELKSASAISLWEDEKDRLNALLLV